MSKVVKIDSQGNTDVVIDGIVIRQDAEGRYCLNDFHKAAGGELRHKPSRWTENQQTQELIEEIGKAGIPALRIAKGGRAAGTYVAKELVYAYAMWISAPYHLKVIRAYDRLATQGVAVHENAAQDLLDNPLKYIQALMGQAQALADENAKLTQKVERDKPKVEYHDAVKVSVNCQTLEQVGKKYGIGRTTLFRFLREQQVLRNAEYNPPYQRFIDSGHFEVDGKHFKKDGSIVTYSQTMVTGKGEIYIGDLLHKAGMLTDEDAA